MEDMVELSKQLRLDLFPGPSIFHFINTSASRRVVHLALCASQSSSLYVADPLEKVVTLGPFSMVYVDP